MFANFAEAVAEGRGKAQAETLRKMRQETMARRLLNGQREEHVRDQRGTKVIGQELMHVLCIGVTGREDRIPERLRQFGVRVDERAQIVR